MGKGSTRGWAPTAICLAVLLYAECAQALRCYSCKELTTAADCMTVTNCTATETMCKTTMYSREDVFPFMGDSTVTRACASECTPSDVDGIGTTRPVSCCNTDLCNTDGATSLQIGYFSVGAALVALLVCLQLQQ